MYKLIFIHSSSLSQMKMKMGTIVIAIANLLPVLLVHLVHGESYKDKATRIPENKGCNIYQGKWVYDSTYPLYNSATCRFLEKQFNCQNSGRRDMEYLKYRWEPSSCKLPRFDGHNFLRRFEGKRVMFVGDSLSLNQWQSLTCMLHTQVPQAKYTLTRKGGLSTFTYPAYNFSVMFLRNAYLVDIVSGEMGRVLKLQSIGSGQIWQGFDAVIFNSWHWWLHKGRKRGWDFIEDEKKTYKDMNRFVAYNKALITWAKWVESNRDFDKTKIIFQGVSPDHANSTLWGASKDTDCRGEMKPIMQQSYGQNQAQVIVDQVLDKMSKPVYMLNITALSQLRKDGHPSVYGFGGFRAADCSHWCLPGVPDAWNELLYATLI